MNQEYDKATLDLGSGPNPRSKPGYTAFGVDISASPLVEACQLGFQDLPFDDNSFDFVTAYDLLEHIPKVVYVSNLEGGAIIYPTIRLFNEVHRVLKPGGYFESLTPHYPNIQEVWRDPTHCQVWVTEAWDYYTGSYTDLMERYGYKARFRKHHSEWRGPHFYVALQKEK